LPQILRRCGKPFCSHNLTVSLTAFLAQKILTCVTAFRLNSRLLAHHISPLNNYCMVYACESFKLTLLSMNAASLTHQLNQNCSWRKDSVCRAGSVMKRDNGGIVIDYVARLVRKEFFACHRRLIALLCISEVSNLINVMCAD
jgi:hypothetical protein